MKEVGRAVGVVLGSAMGDEVLKTLSLQPLEVITPYGPQRLFEGVRSDGVRILALHRHGFPHRHLPHTIPFRAQIWALRMRGCAALVLNSSVGVLDPSVPLFTPMLATDLLMPENRLPDGSLCTLFTPEAMAASRTVQEQAGHLVLTEGIFSLALRQQLHSLGIDPSAAPNPLTFVYAPGPRTKTPAENRYWFAAGGHVNSMSIGPEAVLACEVGIPCAALLVGHKPSTGHDAPLDREAVAASLEEAGRAALPFVLGFLEEGQPVPPENLIFRF